MKAGWVSYQQKINQTSTLCRPPNPTKNEVVYNNYIEISIELLANLSFNSTKFAPLIVGLKKFCFLQSKLVCIPLGKLVICIVAAVVVKLTLIKHNWCEPGYKLLAILWSRSSSHVQAKGETERSCFENGKKV